MNVARLLVTVALLACLLGASTATAGAAVAVPSDGAAGTHDVVVSTDAGGGPAEPCMIDGDPDPDCLCDDGTFKCWERA